MNQGPFQKRGIGNSLFEFLFGKKKIRYAFFVPRTRRAGRARNRKKNLGMFFPKFLNECGLPSSCNGGKNEKFGRIQSKSSSSEAIELSLDSILLVSDSTLKLERMR